MNKLIESSDYPYIPIYLELDEFRLKEPAYVDTGAAVHGLYIPDTLVETNKIKQTYFTVPIVTGDGKTHLWKSYLGKIKIGVKEFLSSIVIVDGGKRLILGRDILDKLISIFDGPKQKVILNTD